MKLEDKYTSQELLQLDAFLIRLSETQPDLSSDLMADITWERLGFFIDGDDVISRLSIYQTDGDNHFSLN